MILQPGKTITGMQSIVFKIENHEFVLLNVYMPTRADSTREMGKCIHTLRTKYPNQQLLLIGDLNCPMLKWNHSEEEPGVHINTSHNCPPCETKLIEIAAEHSSQQTNACANSNGTFLDLMLSTDTTNITVERVPVEELLD